MPKTMVTAKTRHTSLDAHPIRFALIATAAAIVAIVLVSLASRV